VGSQYSATEIVSQARCSDDSDSYPVSCLAVLLLPLMNVIGLPDSTSAIISSILIAVAQGFLFAVLAYILLYRPQELKLSPPARSN
jgi:hypothetical protein